MGESREGWAVSMMMQSTLALAGCALGLEALAGYPQWLYRTIAHPVTWIGGLIGALDQQLNRDAYTDSQRRFMGCVCLACVLTISGGSALLLQFFLEQSVVGFCALVACAASLPAQRSLFEHVRAVADALSLSEQDARKDDSALNPARAAVAHIVGRDVGSLDSAGIARAAIESLAENFSDGVVAPAFWLSIGGLPGGVLYKAINTADSMIGHLTPRHRAFGWASARLDDGVNLPASRLAAFWIVLAACMTPGARAAAAVRAISQDARRHRSPNAGWPEAAMAGALDLKLAGPRVYQGVVVVDAFMGEGRRDATVEDIRKALALYRTACLIQASVLLICLVITAVLQVG